MKNYLIVLCLFFSLTSCNKSIEFLINPCRICSYTTEKETVKAEVCDDSENNQILIQEMEDRMQKAADAVNAELVCKNK